MACTRHMRIPIRAISRAATVASGTDSHHGGLVRSQGCRRTSSEAFLKNPIIKTLHTSVNSRAVQESPFGEISITEENLAHSVMKEFPSYGDRVALIDSGTGERWTYAQLTDAITSVSSGLVKMGLQKGDVITIFSPNCPEFGIMYLAAMCAGVIVSAVNPVYTAGELEHALVHSHSKYLVLHPVVLPIAKAVAAKCPELQGMISFGEAEGCRSFSSLLNESRESFPENIKLNPKDDLCALPYSSGTTGLPKGVMLTHYNVVANTEQLCVDGILNYTPGEETFLAVLPFFHIYGQVVMLLCGLKKGATLVVTSKFDPLQFLKAVQEHQVSYLHIVPPIALLLAKHPVVDQFDISCVDTAFVGAAPVSADVMTQVQERLKLKFFRQGYGLTETSPVTHATLTDSNIFGSVGKAIPSVQFKIVDISTGEALGPHQEGELLVRGPNVMKGYFKNEEATMSTIKDGWLHTGDIGYYDNEGHTFISDRLKELIKVKGLQVAPAELEALLVTHPKIQDAAVIGKPDERAGELPRAYVVLKPNQEMSEDEVKAIVAENVAPYKKLEGGVEFRGEIPKSASGKILRRQLKDEMLGSKPT